MDFSKILLIVLALIGVSLADEPPKNCHQYIEFIISGKTVPNITQVLPFIMYSGITSNNPGQKYECEHTIGFQNNYFLIDWKNSTNNLDIFTGICVPSFCSKEEIQTSLHQYPQIKNSKVYDYPADPETDSLLIFSTVIFGIWVGILTIWSIVVSCRAPIENQLIKKNQQIKTPDDTERVINALSQQRVAAVKQDFKLFNFYQGYCRIFKKSKNISLMAPILFLASFSIIFSMEFSFRQNIAANQVKALRWFDSFGGLMFCNVQIAFSVIIFIFGLKLATSLHKLGSFHEIGRFFFDDLLVKWASLFFISLFSYFFIGFTDQPLNKLWREKTIEQCPSTLYQLWFLFRGLQFDGKTCMPWLWVLQSQILLSILAAPFYIIYKTKKSLGYILFSLIIFTSILVGYAVLDNQSVVFEPYKIFNMPSEYSINYQSSTIIRMSPFFIGILFGLFVSEGIDKPESQQNKGFVKSVRRNEKLQLGLHIVGASLMIAMYLLIIPYLKMINADETRQGAYGYIIFAPLGFLVGLMLFMLPCLWQGENKFTVILNKVFHAGLWSSLDKMIIGFLTMGPVVIGFTTYSMQNSIYFDFETVFIYFLGDAVILYVLALLIVSALVMQLQFISKWFQSKLFKQESKYSVLILQD